MSKLRENTALCGLERATRYDIQMGVRYRPSGETEWREAQTENISRSGVLLRVSEALNVSALVEMRFSLPLETGGEKAAEVFCEGWVVRAERPPAREKLPVMAAKILDYRFERGRNGCEA
jgi:hypothetical protein